MNILESYNRACGQATNVDKFSIFFSKNTRQEIRETVMAKLGNMQQVNQTKYSAALMTIRRSKCFK